MMYKYQITHEDALVVSIGAFSFNRSCFHTIWKTNQNSALFIFGSGDVDVFWKGPH